MSDVILLNKLAKRDPKDVLIHVKDENKNILKDFYVKKDILKRFMRYF